MQEITLFKMPFSNNLFNKNQRVFVVGFTGAQACHVVGRFRGKHRYIQGWVRYDTKCKQNSLPDFKKIMVDDSFYKKVLDVTGLTACSFR